MYAAHGRNELGSSWSLELEILVSAWVLVSEHEKWGTEAIRVRLRVEN